MKIHAFSEIVAQHKVIFFDSYGVLKNHRGLIKGVPEVIQSIRAQNIPIRILTNDASRSSDRQASKFAKLGLPGLMPHEIIPSGLMAERYLKSKFKSGKVAYLGTNEAAQFIENANLEAIPVGKVKLEEAAHIKAMVFLDDEGFDWNYDINATLNLLRKYNIPAVVANSDQIYPVAKNDVSIATGGIAKLVQTILGKNFIHFGKPDSQMFMYAMNQLSQEIELQKEDILMVGDTLHTDILGGNKFGISTALVLTGNTSAKNAETLIHATGIMPDFICASIIT